MANSLSARLHEEPKIDQRDPFARDRDRILYCSAFRRLGETTQVASSPVDHIFHNRLTHSLEVAQISRRMTEYLAAENPKQAKKLNLNADVAETAALAHDLGHPPFGHIGEKAIDEAILEVDQKSDGFEGNAQTFRILVSLAMGSPFYAGLNLTRASLNGVLKYPWLRPKNRNAEPKKWRKFGVYRSDRAAFEWARKGFDAETRSVEAEIMDVADEIAYAVHDLFDLFRAGLIPMDRLVRERTEFDGFVEQVRTRLKGQGRELEIEDREVQTIYKNVFELFPLLRPYEGTQLERGLLKSYSSLLIHRHVLGAIKLAEPSRTSRPKVHVDLALHKERDLLSHLTQQYVIFSPTLAEIQFGQKRLIREVFTWLWESAKNGAELLPDHVKAKLDGAEDNHVRLIADVVASLTESQLVHLHSRLSGRSSGTIAQRIFV